MPFAQKKSSLWYNMQDYVATYAASYNYWLPTQSSASFTAVPTVNSHNFTRHFTTAVYPTTFL